MQSDAKAIAEGLTEAQRAVVLEMGDGELVHTAPDIAFFAKVTIPEVRATMKWLRAEGMAEHGVLYNEEEQRQAGSGTWLNSRGLKLKAAVKAQLERTEP